MKQLSRIASALALAAGLFASSQASALTICSNCLYTAAGATNLGTHNSTTNDTSGFRRDDLMNSSLVGIPVTDTWAFELQPVGGRAQLNANFLPLIPSAFSSYVINIYSSTNTCALGIGNSTGTTGFCSSIVLGALQGTSVTGVGNTNLFPVTLLAGSYAMVVSYILNPIGSDVAQYSGQLLISRAIPEPGSLALAGLALIGVAASLRRSRKA